ncbi:MAG: polyprenyl diphosphate synthase [Candidatus Nitrosoabyssus spongiisocia]|nr:MAG: polyprenyl diphosphate synthase [Nitrosopumilaceae archaeon AB1(1)]
MNLSWSNLSKLSRSKTPSLLKDNNQCEKPLNHVAVILDGNRRWALHNSKTIHKAYSLGAETATNIILWWTDLDIKILSLYLLSIENLQRYDGLPYLYELMEKKLQQLYDDSIIHTHKIQVKGIGKIDNLPQNVQSILKKLEDVTKDYDSRFLNLALAYGGQTEILDAVKKISAKVKCGSLNIDEIDKHIIEENLYTSHLPYPSPDLILRTSGEKRLSDFLTWQSGYSELFFIDQFWPDFTKNTFLKVLNTFQNRNRRLGL